MILAKDEQMSGFALPATDGSETVYSYLCEKTGRAGDFIGAWSREPQPATAPVTVDCYGLLEPATTWSMFSEILGEADAAFTPLHLTQHQIVILLIQHVGSSRHAHKCPVTFFLTLGAEGDTRIVKSFFAERQPHVSRGSFTPHDSTWLPDREHRVVVPRLAAAP